MKKLFVSDVTFCNKGSVQSLSFREKLNIAAALEKAGIDAIELPEPTDRLEDAVVYSTIAQSMKNAKVVVSAGFTTDSIKHSFECVKSAKSAGIKVALPVSTTLMEYTYHYKAPKMLEKITELCSAAAALCGDVEFVAIDATRADSGFVADCAKAATQAGAKAVTLCDTAGVAFPSDMANLVSLVKAECDALVYVEPSNELSLAAAVALEAVGAGADGVKTSLEGGLLASDFARVIRARGLDFDISSNLDHTLIESVLGDKAEGEIAPSTSEAADSVKFDKAATIDDISGYISGLGYELSSEDIGKIYDEFKRLVDKKGAIGRRELEAVVASCSAQVPSTYHLENYVVNSGDIINATANITLSRDGEILSGVSIGDGPIDAAFQAIEQIVGHHYELDDFKIYAVTKGREAIGSSIIRLRANGKLYGGNGASTDIIGACIRAYINALNKIVYEEK